MLDLEELFKKRPFIYKINGDYYAFGCGVCSVCNKHGNYVTLPRRYEDYLAIKDEAVSSKEAWDVYRRLVAVAEMVKDREDNVNLKQMFQKLNFDNESMLELEKQLADMVDFFRKNRLVNYYR